MAEGVRDGLKTEDGHDDKTWAKSEQTLRTFAVKFQVEGSEFLMLFCSETLHSFSSRSESLEFHSCYFPSLKY